MKKIINLIGTLLVLAIIISVFTVPSKEKCRAYAIKNMADTSTIKPTITEAPFKLFGVKIFSTFTATYYKIIAVPQLKIANADSTKPITIGAVRSASNIPNQKYIGAFGSFFKW